MLYSFLPLETGLGLYAVVLTLILPFFSPQLLLLELF